MLHTYFQKGVKYAENSESLVIPVWCLVDGFNCFFFTDFVLCLWLVELRSGVTNGQLNEPTGASHMYLNIYDLSCLWM